MEDIRDQELLTAPEVEMISDFNKGNKEECQSVDLNELKRILILIIMGMIRLKNFDFSDCLKELVICEQAKSINEQALEVLNDESVNRSSC